MLQMITNRSPAPRKQTGAPPPRRYAAFPSPYGGE